MSVWALTWAPGAATPIHDHHCSCCFAVARGALVERRFRALPVGRAALDRAARRQAGFAALPPGGPTIHPILNDGPDEAVSIPIYGFDHTMHASVAGV